MINFSSFFTFTHYLICHHLPINISILFLFCCFLPPVTTLMISPSIQTPSLQPDPLKCGRKWTEETLESCFISPSCFCTHSLFSFKQTKHVKHLHLDCTLCLSGVKLSSMQHYAPDVLPHYI